MTRRTKVGLLIVAMVALGGVLAFSMVLRHGFRARDEPTALEAFIARRVGTLH